MTWLIPCIHLESCERIIKLHAIKDSIDNKQRADKNHLLDCKVSFDFLKKQPTSRPYMFEQRERFIDDDERYCVSQRNFDFIFRG
jgi:hypothetical protein